MTLKARHRLMSFIAMVMTVSIAVTSAVVPYTAFAAAPAAPEFSVKGGIYDGPVSVTISGEGEIYYTTDGSVPTRSANKYTSPIYINSSSGNFPKATTIRAAAFLGNEGSAVSSGTYFVGGNVSGSLGGVPIVNLVAEPYDLWDSQNGIYTNWEYALNKIPAVFHYITPEGKTEINRNVEIKISGHGSRSAAKKSFRVYFKKTDPAQGKYLEYNLVPQAGVDYYANINFRITDWEKTNIKDTLAQKIGKQTRVDIAESTPTALFLNGEYWGLYECREHYNDEYFASHYGLDKDTIVYLDRDWQRDLDETVVDGTTYYDKIEYSDGPKDGNNDGILGETYYRNQWAYIKSLVISKDITSADVYEEFCSKVDIDNFIDYIITYIYCANDDWPGNNFKFWRVTEEAVDDSDPVADGKWRFMIHDFDIAFDDINHDTLYLSTRQKDHDTAARHPKYATDLLDNLLKNADFRSEFAQRTAVYLSTIMGKDSIDGIVNSLVDERRAAKPMDVTRWNLGGMNKWNNEINWLHRYANERPAKLREQYRNNLNRYYGAGITGEAKVNVDSVMDYSVNGALMTEGESGELTVFAGMPLTVKAENADITVACGDGRFSGTDSLTFIPATDSYEINIEPADGQDHSLVLYYSFENDSANPNSITDDSGNGNNGRVLNNEGYPRLITVENATNGKVLNIPGGEWSEGAAVKIPEAARMGISGDYTVSMWVKADGSYMWGDKLQRFFDFGVSDYNSIFVRYNVQTGDLRFQDRGKPGLTGGNDPNGYISTNNRSFIDRWGLLTVTYTSADNTATVYVNGEPVMSGSKFPRSLGDIPTLTNERYGMYLGRTQWQNTDNPDFRGLMDEVRIYNRAISEEEIEELYLTTDPEAVAQTKEITLCYMADGIELGRENVEIPRSGSFTYSQAPAIAYNGKLYTAGAVVITDTAAVGREYTVNMTDTPFWTDNLSVNAYVGENANLPRTAKLCYDGGTAEVSLSYDGSFSFDKAGVYIVSGKHNGITVDITVKVYERWLNSSGSTIGRASKVNVHFTDATGAEIAETYENIVRTETTYTLTDKLLGGYPHIANAVIPEPVIITEPVHEIYVTGEKLIGVFGKLSAGLGDGVLNASAKVVNTGEAETEAMLIIARYEEQKLTETKTEKVKLPANSLKVLDLSANLPYDRQAGQDVRVCLWTADLRPLDGVIIASELPDTNNYSSEIMELIPEYETIKGDVLAANNYWQTNNSYDQHSFWDIAAYHTGNMETYLTFGGENYLQYSKDWANARKWMGNVNTWTPKDSWTWNYPFWDSDSGAEVLHGDWQICFQTYLDLYMLDPDNSDISRVEEVMGYQITKNNDDFWWWADALYMVPPVMTKLYRLTGDEKYLDKLYEYYRFSAELMYDGELGIPNNGEAYTTSAESYKKDGAAYSDPNNYANLFFRDAGYVYPLSPNPGHDGEKNFWARGNGWVFAGLAKILSDIPRDYKHRDFFETIYNEMAASIIACQVQDDQGNGFWTQSMLQNYPTGGGNDWGYETSGTAFFTYGLFWGLNNGMLDEETYLEPALRSWKYLSEVALQDGGKVGYCQQIGSNATQATPWYVEQSFGYGAFLLAGCEASRWVEIR